MFWIPRLTHTHTHTHTHIRPDLQVHRTDLHYTLCLFYLTGKMYSQASRHRGNEAHVHSHCTLSDVEPSTPTTECTCGLFTDLMSLDDRAWQTSLFGTHLGLVCNPPCPPTHPPISLLFRTSTRATHPSSRSTAPIHQHTAINCQRSVTNYFPHADVLAYQTFEEVTD